MDGEELDEVRRRREEWERDTLDPVLDRFDLDAPRDRFYGPDDVPEYDFLTDVGFPGQYPFTAGTYPTVPYAAGERGTGMIPQGAGFARAGRYSGYGGPEDSADYYRRMIADGQRAGPNVAFDLPTQCGYDSDSPFAAGEVGRTGVAIDSMDDFRVLYEPFTGPLEIDRVASNWTINAPAAIIVAMFYLLANERGVELGRLRATPQNDILKEFIARGTYIFPPLASMRLVRDVFLFATEKLPSMNVISGGGYHIREAGATRELDLGFSMANGVEYLRTGVEAGIDIDVLAPRVTFNAFGGSLDLFREVAFQRAARRVWATIVRDRFGARDPRSWLLRQPSGAHMGYHNATVNRPLNNLTRSVVGAIASALSGYAPVAEPPFDEPLGLGWSREGMQLSEDAARVLTYEARVTEVRDPLAGSYYVERLTDDLERAAWEIIEDIDHRGGAVAAVESGYMAEAVTASAIERARAIRSGQEIVVGVNAFTSADEIEVEVSRRAERLYDPERLEQAEDRQLRKLAALRLRRDGRQVVSALKALMEASRDESVPLVPLIVDCLRADATVGEICDSLRETFGEYRETATVVRS